MDAQWGGRHAAAHSKHMGGVMGSMTDGSVRFFANGVDLFAWRALGTRDRGELAILP